MFTVIVTFAHSWNEYLPSRRPPYEILKRNVLKLTLEKCRFITHGCKGRTGWSEMTKECFERRSHPTFLKRKVHQKQKGILTPSRGKSKSNNLASLAYNCWLHNHLFPLQMAQSRKEGTREGGWDPSSLREEFLGPAECSRRSVWVSSSDYCWWVKDGNCPVLLGTAMSPLCTKNSSESS